VTAWQDREFREILNKADLSLPDGYGLKIFAGISHVVPGVDFMRALCRQAAENAWTVGLFGGKEGVAHRTASQLIKIYPKIKIPLIIDGTAADEVLGDLRRLRRLRRLRPVDILFVALGHPKQEKFLWALSQGFQIENFKLKIRVGMGVGGSFDFISGEKEEPPAWLRKLGLKWLGRLVLNPGHLFRVLKAAVVFPLLLILSMILLLVPPVHTSAREERKSEKGKAEG
jgi:N-acetylglucosaminyldiphosphoundecaprenol N-acetyl-beta-D-mannosaminyltransferase